MKQVLVMREDLGMSPGKLASQAAHAAVAACNLTSKDDLDEWGRTGTTKIVLGVYGQDILISLYKTAVSRYLPAALICDEGRTEVTPGTITGLGIGPAEDEEINEITGHLHLYGKGE